MKRLMLFIFVCTAFAGYGQLYKNDVFTIYGDRVVEQQNDKTFTGTMTSDGRIITDYDGVKAERAIDPPDQSMPSLVSWYNIIDKLYYLALMEAKLDINKDGFFVAGEKWNQAWTRDMSYAINLSLPIIYPDVCVKSLETRVFNDAILQDTGTGGSWPISTDRVIWAVAAYETALIKDDPEYYKKVYGIIKKSIDRDLEVAYDAEKGLFKGEQSFLDWREQTYPRWMNPVNIGESYALATNAVHYKALEILSVMSAKLGNKEDSDKYRGLAAKVKDGLNKYMYSEKTGYYSAYLIGGENEYRYDGYETLGESLSILYGISEGKDNNKILNAVKPGNYGMTVVAPQLKNVTPYHNNSVWPFVQGYRAMAAASAGDLKTLEDEFYALVRSGALFMTFKENLVSSTGNKKGTAINSDRQLWSVASYLGFIYKILFGITYTEDGLTFRPAKFASLKNNIILNNYKYKNGFINIEVRGTGSVVDYILFDGAKKDPSFVVPKDIKGYHKVVVTLKMGTTLPPVTPVYNSADEIKVVENLKYSVSGRRLSLEWTSSGDKKFRVLENGVEVGTTDKTEFSLNLKDDICEYAVEEISQTLPSIKGMPVYPELKKNVTFIEAEKSEYKGGKESDKIITRDVSATKAAGSSELNRYAHNQTGYIDTWGETNGDYLNFKVSIKEGGYYVIDFRYQNGGPINTGEKCALRELSINGDYKRVVYFPHVGNWMEWGFSSGYGISLDKGDYIFTLKTGDKSFSQKDKLVGINLDLLRIRKFKK